MKQILLCFLILSLFSCSKEKTNSLQGEWTIVETNAGTGSGFITKTYPAGSDITIHFSTSGEFKVTGPNPGASNSKLWEFNKYELLSDQTIRLYNSTSGLQTNVSYTMENGLEMSYQYARCGMFEKFIRH
jgi:hypothetical protein